MLVAGGLRRHGTDVTEFLHILTHAGPSVRFQYVTLHTTARDLAGQGLTEVVAIVLDMWGTILWDCETQWTYVNNNIIIRTEYMT